MRTHLLLIALAFSQLTFAAGPKKIPIGQLVDQMVRRSALAEPNGKPFYLKATLTDKDDSNSPSTGTMEEYWVSPTKWRRTVKLHDFSQTRIVNGDQVFEENSGDYFPVHSASLIDEIVDPVPQSAIQLMKQLDMQATEPGGAPGQCMAEKYFNDSSGAEKRVLLAYNCQTGLLIYLWSPTCCYGLMTDYRKFHDKQIAYATKDNPINIHIETLRDLKDIDEKMFAIEKPTPPEQRLVLASLSETEARRRVLKQGEIQWPKTANKPREGTIKLNLVIGRDGKVKDAYTYSPIDNSIEDAVLTAAREWTFQPDVVEGIPAQVQTELSIAIPASLMGADTPPVIKPAFDRLRTVNDIRAAGATAFRMTASFHTEDNSAQGTYEEIWIGPRKWRRTVKMGGETVSEALDDKTFYRSFPGKYAPRIADDVMDGLSFNLPGDGDTDLHEVDWRLVPGSFGGVTLQVLARGYVSPQGKPDAQTDEWMFEEKSALLRARQHDGIFTVFNSLQRFNEFVVGRKGAMFDNNGTKIIFAVDSLEAIKDPNTQSVALEGVKPLYGPEESDQRFTPAKPVHTVKPQIPPQGAKIVCELFLDQRGHVRQVDIKTRVDPGVTERIRAALFQWEYEPGTMNGRPMISPATVNVQ